MSAGITPQTKWIINGTGSEIEDGEKGMELLLAQKERPTAVFCFNDLMAIGALKTLQRHHIRIPQEFSVTGFDNIPYSAYTTPALTTFDQPKRLIGAEAAELLLDLIRRVQGGNPCETPESRVIRGQLLVRESTARAMKG